MRAKVQNEVKKNNKKETLKNEKKLILKKRDRREIDDPIEDL